MNEVLKPCPFCGEEAELQYGGNGNRESTGMSFVRCKKCGAIGQKFEVSRKYSSDEKAIEAWNSWYYNWAITGQWLDVGSLSYRCSECGEKSNKESKYCPNCGSYNEGV